MEAQAGSVPLTSVLATLGGAARAVVTEANLEWTHVVRARIWVPGEAIPEDNTLLVVPAPAANPEMLHNLLEQPGRLAIALCGPLGPDLGEDTFSTSRHSLIRIPALENAAAAITAVDELANPKRNVELRKLTSLQRSFSQALNQPAPVTEILKRLKRQTNAVCLIVDTQGRVHESTGTIPLSLLLEQIRKTPAETQQMNASGWEGLAVRLQPLEARNTAESGWLLVAARRKGFPDAQSSAAVHIAATLIESARRTQRIARDQEEAVRTAIFDEALELDPRPDSPELASRLAALGFSLSTSLRVLAVSGTHPALLSRRTQQDLQRTAERALEGEEIPYLVTTRGDTTVLLAQAEVDAITHALRLRQEGSPAYLAGIGREVQSVADVAGSFADAVIGIRNLRAGKHNGNTMSFEQFDFATRVFASVGIERMAEYSREFLEPLLKREPMLEALRTYFQHAQNTSAAAHSLGIHHNTLRYRLSKVEEALEVDLNEPSTVTSLFLAIAALDLKELGAAKHLTASETIGRQEKEMTHTGISSPGTERTLSESITRSRPPRTRKY